MKEAAPAMLATTPEAAARREAARFGRGQFLLHLNKAREHAEAGRLLEARVELEQAAAIRPHDELALNLLGMVYFRLDLRSEAIDVYRLLVQKHPEADVLHANLGILEFKQGRYDDAVRRLETALLLNPRNPRPHLYLGLIGHRRGDLEGCLAHLKAAGAVELARRIENEAKSPGAGAGRHDETVETGPIATAPEATAETVFLAALSAAAQDRVEHLGAAGGTMFRLLRGAGPSDGDLVEVCFSMPMCVRLGSLIDLIWRGGEPSSSPPGPAGMITLRERGRLHLATGDPRHDRILLLSLPERMALGVSRRRLLAHDAAMAGRDEGASEAPSRPSEASAGHRLTGHGCMALAVGRGLRMVAISAGESLLVDLRDLVCWGDGLRVRPTQSAALTSILRASPGAGNAIRVEGAGEILLDSPA